MQTNSHKPAAKALASLLLAGALFGSGAAGLVNQVVWQRALKVYLGGSESICSMIVVLVFMGGLGVGSILMGRRAARLKSPIRTFAVLETLLGLANLAVCGALTIDISQSVFAFQSAALSIGLPLTLLYAAGALVVLGVPCLLMGMTMPLAAETCQRNLGVNSTRLLGLLLFVNTIGSVFGAIVSGGDLIAAFGTTRTLLLAAGLNVAAGGLLVVLWLANRSPSDKLVKSPNEDDRNAPYPPRRVWLPNSSEVIAAALGFIALSFEMYLFRLVPLRHLPLPYTFAAVLAGYLAYWSLGAALSSIRRHLSMSTVMRITALSIVATVPMFVWDTQFAMRDSLTMIEFIVCKFPYFLPCIGFGYLFGLLNRLAVKSWGHDVGRLAGWNTIGSCGGVLVTTLFGFELPFFLMPLVAAMLLAALQEYTATEFATKSNEPPNRRWLVPAAAAAAFSLCPLFVDLKGVIPGQQVYCGREGVILVEPDGDVNWNGLWHSALSYQGNHVGSDNWHLAICPVVCHPTGDIKDVCVIGVSTGITASAFAKLESVEQVDGYDISRMLQRIYADFPTGTLNIATNPKINLIWQDARTGLNLNPKKYDIIQTQPLYLKQAGSSILNSQEFFQLVASRLKSDGVFCVYSNGTPEQALAVRETAKQVFQHEESFFNGYLLVLSNSPIRSKPAEFVDAYETQDPLWDEIRSWDRTSTPESFTRLLDRPRLYGGLGELVITDTQPVVEYPEYLKARVKEVYGELNLPQPVTASMSVSLE